ncbi:MAG: response regulator transcription factor [Lachnospiraceae bacterium]|nr:response regulator transcription factor [Lachnospiraceae bacterium]
MRILLAEDDRQLNKTLSWQLSENGFTVDSCFDGEEALFYGEQNIHDVILLDRMLPHMEGTEVLTLLRKKNIAVPIILITALGTLSDKITGLDLGADDYLVKPFAFEELLARIRCVTRRPPTFTDTGQLHFLDITLCPEEGKLVGPKETCTLSKKESALLETFLRAKGQTLSRNTLILKVWGPESDIEDGNLDNYIHFLRRRLSVTGSSLKIKTIRGIGYCLPEESLSQNL